MKKTIVISLGAAVVMGAVVLPASVSATPKPTPNTYVSEDAQETVERMYPNAQDLRWSSEGDVYTAYFNQPFSKVVANVDGEGNLINVLTYYDQGQMPLGVRTTLKEKFPKLHVKFVTRDEEEGTVDDDVPTVTYQATLEDATHWYIVTVSGNQITKKQVLLKA